MDGAGDIHSNLKSQILAMEDPEYTEKDGRLHKIIPIFGRFSIYDRHSRECGNPAIRRKADWIPAFAGMTNKNKIYR
jgi:hypothetical protein